MTRISENQAQRTLVTYTAENKRRIEKLSRQLSSGLKVERPGDSPESGTVARYQQMLQNIENFATTASQTREKLTFQDEITSQAHDIVVRAKEIATQAANDSVNVSGRATLAEEVFQMRDHLVNLANSTFQGRYVFGGLDDDDPPFDAGTYTNPATGAASVRYFFDNEAGTTTSSTVNLTENVTITVSTPGDQIFGDSIAALERLGRALAGYETLPSVGTPDGTGAAYTFPTDFAKQSSAIQGTIDLLESAREGDILPERVSLGGRMRRIDTAEALLELTRRSAQEALGRIQNADETETAASLASTQNALEASYSVTARVLRLTVLDYL
jgi:flagellar hook-associated protein 3 FlgL